MKKMKMLVLGLATFGMLLSGCSNAAPNVEEFVPETNEDLTSEEMYDVLSEWTPSVSFTNDPEFNPTFDEMSLVPESEQNHLSSSVFDLKKGDAVRIKLMEDTGVTNGAFATQYRSIVSQSYSYDQYISVNDVNGQDQDIVLTTDGSCISLPINDSFDYGGVYIIELIKDDTLYFEGKDQSIQKLTVEIEDDPNEEATYDIVDKKTGIEVLDLAKVSNESVDSTSIYSFDYNGSVPAFSKGDVFVVKNNTNAEELAITDFYGKFLSKENLGDGKYRVYYEQPQGSDIYNNLRKKGVSPMSLEGHITPIDVDEQFYNSIRYSDFSRGFLNFCSRMNRTKNSRLLGDMLDNLKVDITYNYYNEKLTFGINIHVDQIELKKSESGENALYLSFAIKYTQIVSFKADFDIGIKTKWCIPVGISYKLKMIQLKQESVEFDISVTYEKKTEPLPEDDIKNTLVDELKKAKEDEHFNSFYDRIVNDASVVAQTEGNKTTIPLFSVDCVIYPPLVFEFKIDFIINLSIQAMLVIKKQWESETVLFNFSNEGGGDSDTGQTIKGSNYWDVYLMGKIELTLSLRFSGNLYLAGTYKFCHVAVYFEIYVTIGIQGVLTASFPTDTDGSDFLGNVSIDLYVLMGARVGLEIVIAFFSKDLSRDIFKTYILRVVFTNSLEKYAIDAEDSIVMNKTIMSIDETNVLKFTTWNGVFMRMEDVKYSATSVTKLIESWFGDLNVRMFSFEPSEPDKMEISDDGVIHIKDGTPADFTTTFKVKISNFAGFISDKDISLTFHDPGAKHIYMEEEDLGRYRQGYVYTLPEAPSKDGYKFLNYKYNDQTLKPGDTITVGDSDIHITIDWHKIIYYTVIFYDGHNNLIYIDTHVEEFTPVTPPPPEIRDQFMTGYFFVGWDKKIDYITSDLVVHGIYMKVGD